MESTKYDAALAIAGAIGGSSTEKNFIKNPYKNGDGIENFAIFLN